MESANSGAEALKKLSPVIDLVLLDVKMPDMDGLEVARRIRQHASCGDVPIVMVTALGEKKVRLDAVKAGANDFISKPVDITELEIRTKALMERKESQDEIKSQRAELKKAYASEKEILEKTLRGTMRILVDVLSLVSPLAFSQASRLRRYMQQISVQLDLENAWQYEIAAMLFQIGCVTIPRDILEKYHENKELTREEREIFQSHPAVGRELLVNIPRLESVAQMVAHQIDAFDNIAFSNVPNKRDLVTGGAQILKTLIKYDLLLTSGGSHQGAINRLKGLEREYDPQIVDAIANLDLEAFREPFKSVNAEIIPIADLRVGMVLEDDVITKNGIMVARKGQEVNLSFIKRLQNFVKRKEVVSEIRILAPKTPGS